MLASGSVIVDTTEFPIVLLTERGPQASATVYLEVFEQLLVNQSQRFVSLHDVRTVHGWDLPDRVVVHAWLKQHAPRLGQLVLGHATVVNGIKQRTMAGAVFWGTKFEQNVTCFDDLDDARSWARTLLATGRRR
jgi:hypothetical protein